MAQTFSGERRVTTSSGQARAATAFEVGEARTLLFAAGEGVACFGGFGADTVFGDQGRDTLKGMGGRDLVRGNQGNDEVMFGGGNDTNAAQGGSWLGNPGTTSSAVDLVPTGSAVVRDLTKCTAGRVPTVSATGSPTAARSEALPGVGGQTGSGVVPPATSSWGAAAERCWSARPDWICGGPAEDVISGSRGSDTADGDGTTERGQTGDTFIAVEHKSRHCIAV